MKIEVENLGGTLLESFNIENRKIIYNQIMDFLMDREEIMVTADGKKFYLSIFDTHDDTEKLCEFLGVEK